MRTLSLAHLTVLELAPPEVVTVAAGAGFAACNIRIAPARDGEARHPLWDGSPMLRETLARLDGEGVAVHDVEVVRIAPDTDPVAHARDFEVMALLGARRMITVSVDPDPDRTAETLARIADVAEPFGVALDLEFAVWTEVRSLETALRVVAAAGRPNVGVLPDCLHLCRAGTRPEALAAIPGERLAFAQLCDAPADLPAGKDILYEARHDRLPPGEGALPLAAILAALPAELPLSVEVPMAGERGALPPAERARLVAAAARRHLADAIGEQ